MKRLWDTDFGDLAMCLGMAVLIQCAFAVEDLDWNSTLSTLLPKQTKVQASATPDQSSAKPQPRSPVNIIVIKDVSHACQQRVASPNPPIVRTQPVRHRCGSSN